MRHADARTTIRHDMARANLDRHATHSVAAYLAAWPPADRDRSSGRLLVVRCGVPERAGVIAGATMARAVVTVLFAADPKPSMRRVSHPWTQQQAPAQVTKPRTCLICA